MSEASDIHWNLWIKCADLLSDGDLEGSERRYYEREYKRLAKICCPDDEETKAYKREVKQRRNKKINEQMTKLNTEKKCSCGGELKQSRSGSWVAYCVECNTRYKAGSKKK